MYVNHIILYVSVIIFVAYYNIHMWHLNYYSGRNELLKSSYNKTKESYMYMFIFIYLLNPLKTLNVCICSFVYICIVHWIFTIYLIITLLLAVAHIWSKMPLIFWYTISISSVQFFISMFIIIPLYFFTTWR